MGGVGKIVEIDDSKFGRRKYNPGHWVEGQWVERLCFLVPVERQDKETLVPILQEWILPESTIVYDFWKACDCLNDLGYIHLKVNHSLNFVDPDSNAHTNTVECLWRHVKR